MKRLYWVKIFIFAIILSLTLQSCSSFEREKSNQIIASSITLAEFYSKEGNIDEAIEIYQLASENVTDYRIVYNLAYLFAKKGNYKMAIELCEDALRKFDNDDIFLKALSGYKYLDNDFSGARIDCQKYLDLKPEDKETRKIYMKICLEKGYESEAYAQAMILWEGNDFSKEVIDVLFSVKPTEWQEMKKIIN